MRVAIVALLILLASDMGAAAQMGAHGPMGGPMRPAPMAMPMQPPAPPQVPQQRLAKAMDFLAVSGTRQLIESYVQRISPMATMMAQRQLKMSDAGAQKDVTAAMNAELKKSANEILENTARYYAGQFSDSEFDALTGFFRSPAGKKYAGLQQVLQRDTTEAIRAWAMKMQMTTIRGIVQKVAAAHPGSLVPPPTPQPMQPAKPGAPAQ